MNYDLQTLDNRKVAIIKKTIITVIEGMMREKDSERAKAVIGEMRAKKEKEERDEEDKRNRLGSIPVGQAGTTAFKKKERMS